VENFQAAAPTICQRFASSFSKSVDNIHRLIFIPDSKREYKKLFIWKVLIVQDKNKPNLAFGISRGCLFVCTTVNQTVGVRKVISRNFRPVIR
jgi:hypothetical protein